jgi:CubicO group peptidase (beta-lactamase class C family)
VFKPLGMGDTSFVVPASKVGRYVKLADPVEPTLRNALDRTQAPATDCGGGCAVSTAADYLRFAQMLLNKGSLDGRRILGRKTVAFMTAEQLAPEVNLARLHQYPNLNGGYGFGLGVAVRRGSGVAGIMGSPGDYHWGGGSGTYFWVDPQEELVVVFMAAAPAPVSFYNRQLITSLVLQAITD